MTLWRVYRSEVRRTVTEEREVNWESRKDPREVGLVGTGNMVGEEKVKDTRGLRGDGVPIEGERRHRQGTVARDK